jgi:hypothetical protein
MLVGDLDTGRVRNAIRAEILAILRDMGLNPSPTPPPQTEAPTFARRITGRGKVRCQMRGAGARS